MALLDDIERSISLSAAVAQYEHLRARDSEVELIDDEDRGLGRAETLELLALGEIIVRKAAYGRQLAVASARRAGASWAEIGEALGVSRQSAWEAHRRWIDEQAAQHDVRDYEGFNRAEAAHARLLAGGPEG